MMMKQKTIAVIDYSLTSPAICIYTEEYDGVYFDFDSVCYIIYLIWSKMKMKNNGTRFNMIQRGGSKNYQSVKNSIYYGNRF